MQLTLTSTYTVLPSGMPLPSTSITTVRTPLPRVVAAAAAVALLVVALLLLLLVVLLACLLTINQHSSVTRD
jgi:hypothetical protein